MKWINFVWEGYRCLFVFKLCHLNEQATDSKVGMASSGTEKGDRLKPVY